MAVSVNSGMRTIFDGSYTERLNVSEFIDAIDPREIPLLAMLGWNIDGGVSGGADSLAFPCFNTTHTWQNDQLIPQNGTLSGAYTSGGLTLDFTTGQGSYVKVGDYLKVNDAYYVVASISTDAVTVVLLDGESDSNHDAGDRWDNLGTLRVDGAEFSDRFLSTDLSSTSNYTQIFHEEISVSGTSESVEKFGITDEFDREFAKKFQEMLIRLEKAAIYGTKNSLPANNATLADVRRMGGLAEFIRYNSSAVRYDAAGANLTEAMLVDRLESIWELGGKPNMIMVGARQQRRISSWAAPYVRTTRDENSVGVIVNQYESDFGAIDIVLSRSMNPDDLVILTTDYIGIGPLSGNGNSRAFFVTPIPVDGDRKKAAITGEYTMEVRNATTAHGWIYGLGTSLS